MAAVEQAPIARKRAFLALLRGALRGAIEWGQGMIGSGHETPQFVQKAGGLKYASRSALALVRPGSKQMDVLTDALSWGLPAFVILIAVPQGATSALTWIGAALVLSMTGIAYFLMWAVCVPHRPMELRHHRGIAYLGGAILIAAIWGVLPVPMPIPVRPAQ